MIDDRLQLTPLMLLYAFRYALGRHTSAAYDTAAELMLHAERLETWVRAQIAQDIDGYLLRTTVPHDILTEWTRVRNKMIELNERAERRAEDA